MFRFAYSCVWVYMCVYSAQVSVLSIVMKTVEKQLFIKVCNEKMWNLWLKYEKQQTKFKISVGLYPKWKPQKMPNRDL